MRFRTHLLWMLVAGLVAVAGCGDGTTPTDGGPPGDDARVQMDGGGGTTDGDVDTCGDGVVQRSAGETCDDGNTTDGDGCSADCRSDETCGNGTLDLPVGELCDDSNTDDGDGCRGDCRSDYLCGNGVVDTIAEGGAVDEACDDGNTVNGDGCSAACDSDESCGNSIVDLGAGEVCDDGNTVDGDECSADCTMSLLCGNGEIDGAEECDDGNGDAGDGCNDSCQIERCGNGRIDAGEACDDGNADDADGCRADCTYTCSDDAGCDDGDACNGAETCTDPGTATSACAPAASPAPDGTACGTDQICLSGGCVASACGDGFTDTTSAEECDDGNTTDGDGCDNDCTFTCSSDAGCADADVCNGAETCTSPGTATSACVPGTAPAPGTACGSGLICNAGACVAAACGDGLTTGTEQCDDGNTTSGDGCDSDCTWTCSAAADCADTNVCNGAETCTSPGTLASRCAAGTPASNGTSCGGGRVCNMGVCAAAGCGDGIRSGSEQCDDGNTANGDGCDNDCTWTCATAADCSDGNACNGAEVCTMGGTIGSRCGAGTPPASGTSCGGSNICVGGSCVAARCGDAVRSGTEQCDDGNTTNADGCDNDCTWTCATAADCSDGSVCNGAEVCTMGGTIGSRCGAGTPPANGTTCGGSNICVSGSCVAARCGDAIRSGSEQCDDGNTANGDGCDNDCTWTCATAADCSDGNVCNGAEVCTMGGTIGSRCGPGTPAAAGTTCDRDMNAATRDICRMSMCLASTCGDGYVDAGATPVEQCDDGNTANGDGCSSTCQTEMMTTPPTAFRITNLDLISPRITVSAFFSCNDVTQTPFAGFSVNGELDGAINPMSAGGDYSLHIVSLFRPYNPSAATSPGEIQLNAMCMEAPTPDSCGPDAAPDIVTVTATNTSMGTCFAPVAAEVNTRAGSPAAYTPTANTVSGPCFITDPQTLMVDISGIIIPLQDARFAATYSGTTPGSRRLVSGVIRGFLSETAATMINLPADLPLVGGDPLYEHLQAGNRSVSGVSDGCNVGGGTNEDDADMNGATRGFWFFLNFTAEEITWTGT